MRGQVSRFACRVEGGGCRVSSFTFRGSGVGWTHPASHTQSVSASECAGESVLAGQEALLVPPGQYSPETHGAQGPAFGPCVDGLRIGGLGFGV